jgi:hypothetical protein
MKRVCYEDITLAWRHRGDVCDNKKCRGRKAETLEDVAPASVISP